MMKRYPLFLYSLTALTLSAASIAYAEELVTIPQLEGAVTASIGTFYVQPSADNLSYAFDAEHTGQNSGIITAVDFDADYSFGTQAMLGYLFDDTANGIELDYRNLNTSDNTSGTHDFSTNNGFIPGDAKANVGYELNNFDLLLSQYLNLGEHMQLRFLGGLAYVELEQDADYSVDYDSIPRNEGNIPTSGTQHNEFRGWGPRIGVDTRYAFGQGIGIVAGGSAAYYLGNLNITTVNNSYNTDDGTNSEITGKNTLDSHAVTNLRANLGIDYVYHSIGLELGYQVDYYIEAIANTPGNSPNVVIPYDVTFSGPYLNLKGAF
ncbi:MAG: Lpg1974 family pore-forming outer membrane protein [Gammaproteobacteria bacterium]|jgi:hypothetical protein